MADRKKQAKASPQWALDFSELVDGVRAMHEGLTRFGVSARVTSKKQIATAKPHPAIDADPRKAFPDMKDFPPSTLSALRDTLLPKLISGELRGTPPKIVAEAMQ